MKTQAAVVREQSGPFLIEALDIDTPRPNEVLVRIEGAGICHTDLVCRDLEYPVPLPAVFGHEGSGVVEQVGDGVRELAAGDHVVLSFSACGICPSCLQGVPSRCAEIFPCNFSCTRADGSTTLRTDGGDVHGSFFKQSSFASLALAEARNTVKVRHDVPLELLGPLGCGIQTGAGAVMNTLRPPPASSLAVFGCGSVGLSAIMAARVMGCARIVAIDPLAPRRELALELGAVGAVDPADVDPVAAVHEVTGGGADFSLECTGIPAVLRQAMDALNGTGTCCVAGAAPLGAECLIDINDIMFGRTLCGVIEGNCVPSLFIPRLIELYARGLFPIDRLIGFYPLESINQAIEDMASGKVVKPVLRPGR
jgi:aryl-alcohol dehydrogenase